MTAFEIIVALATLAVLVWTLVDRRRWRSSMHESPLLRSAGLPIYPDAVPRFRAELDRVRRYERSLSVLVIKLVEGQFLDHDERRVGGHRISAADAHVLANCASHVVFAGIGSVLRDFLRDIDIAAVDPARRRYVIVLPEADRKRAILAAGRIDQLVREATGAHLRIGTAEFQRDGLLIEDLVTCADSKCDLGVLSGGGVERRSLPTGRRQAFRSEGVETMRIVTFREKRSGPPAFLRLMRQQPFPTEWYARPRPARLRGRRSQRALDLAVALAALPIVLPVFAACAVAIKLDSRGPVLFRQKRTGQGGRRFDMFKLRTMIRDAEARKDEWQHLNRLEPPDFKIPRDPRITRVGHLLRKTSLDELPQIFNVLRGDMSVVGPRPTSFSHDTYQPWHTARLGPRAGITGLWQVSGRNELEFDERVRLDIAYERHRPSLFLDLRILVRTVAVVITRRGAN